MSAEKETAPDQGAAEEAAEGQALTANSTPGHPVDQAADVTAQYLARPAIRQTIEDNHEPTPAEQHLAALLHSLTTSAELMEEHFDPLPWLLADLIPAEGMTVLGSKMGNGKSFFFLQFAAALSTGTPFLERETKRQGVLYIALEDSRRRINSRLNQLGVIGTDKLFIATRWAKGKQALENLRLVLTEYPEIRVVIIDPIVKFIDLIDFNEYGATYGALGPIKDIFDARNVAGIFSHHCRKDTSSLDAFDDILGATGIGAACDTRLVLRRQRGSPEGTLIAGGRDVIHSESALLFDAEHGWQYQGKAEDVRMSDERREIRELLDESGPLRAAEVAKRLDKAENTVRTLLKRLRDTGHVVQGPDKLWKGRSGVVAVVVSKQESTTPTTPTTDVTPTTPTTGKREREERETLTTAERGGAPAQSSEMQQPPADNFDDDLTEASN